MIQISPALLTSEGYGHIKRLTEDYEKISQSILREFDRSRVSKGKPVVKRLGPNFSASLEALNNSFALLLSIVSIAGYVQIFLVLVRSCR